MQSHNKARNKIIYLFEKEEIIVMAVIHGKRSPDLIKKRIVNKGKGGA